ncbi:hypothetical protein [Kitasatospora sp. NPDC092286]|uniref:hypothetical protein n=1 Tax=Kitasatospora sp. NPDC092286 TaxID=3364087 RepID=UPI003815DED6
MRREGARPSASAGRRAPFVRGLSGPVLGGPLTVRRGIAVAPSADSVVAYPVVAYPVVACLVVACLVVAGPVVEERKQAGDGGHRTGAGPGVALSVRGEQGADGGAEVGEFVGGEVEDRKEKVFAKRAARAERLEGLR